MHARTKTPVVGNTTWAPVVLAMARAVRRAATLRAVPPACAMPFRLLAMACAITTALQMDGFPAMSGVKGIIISSSVLHDAEGCAHPGAIEAVKSLQDYAGEKSVTVASTSVADVKFETMRLHSMGFESLREEHVVTAGELFTSSLLDARNVLSPGYWRSPLSGLGHMCAAHWRGTDFDETTLLSRAGSELSDKPHKVGFMLCSNGGGSTRMCSRDMFNHEASELSTEEPLGSDALRVMRDSLKQKLPLVELASDQHIASPVSQLYSALGGKVVRFGKRELFHHAWRSMGGNEMPGSLLKSNVLVVTNSLTADVGLAIDDGFVPCLVRSSGMHARDSPEEWSQNLVHYAQIPENVANRMIRNHDRAWCLLDQGLEPRAERGLGRVMPLMTRRRDIPRFRWLAEAGQKSPVFLSVPGL